MFNPCDDAGEQQSQYALEFDEQLLEPGRWHRVQLDWNARQCRVTIDGKARRTLRRRYDAPNGLSYLRLRSTATDIDTAGFLVDSVAVDVQ